MQDREKLDELLEQICDEICRWRDLDSQEALDEKCDNCPLVQLAEMIGC